MSLFTIYDTITCNTIISILPNNVSITQRNFVLRIELCIDCVLVNMSMLCHTGPVWNRSSLYGELQMSTLASLSPRKNLKDDRM